MGEFKTGHMLEKLSGGVFSWHGYAKFGGFASGTKGRARVATAEEVRYQK